VRDAFGYLEENPGKFDVIVSDTTDPIGMAERLFSDEFYKLMVRALAPGGAAATQCEQPYFDTELIRTIYKTAQALTKNPAYYYTQVPTYPGGGIGLCTFPTRPGKMAENTLSAGREQLPESWYSSRGLCHPGVFQARIVRLICKRAKPWDAFGLSGIIRQSTQISANLW